MDDASPNQTSAPSEGQRRSTAELITFGVALVIVASIAGLVVFDWLSRPRTPPVLSLAQPSDMRTANGQFYVPFEVENTGGQTAESVQVMAELSIDGEVVEQGEQMVEFLAGGETEAGEFVFTHDPERGELTMRIGSYKTP